MPVLASALFRRPGLLTGLLFSLVLLIASGLFLWDVRVEGNEQITTEELLEELSASGLCKGSFLPSVNEDDVVVALRQGDRRIAYATVNRKGTVAYVQIREAALPPPTAKAPANLVAKCDGVVTMPLVFAGECLVREGDVVRAGQLLAGGLIDSEKHGYRITRAAGQILARTTHTYTVQVPFAYEEKRYTGERGLEIDVFFFGIERKVFKSTGNLTEQCDIIKNIKWLTLPGGRQLPFGIAVTQAAAYEQQGASRTAVQARELALAELAHQMAVDSTGRTLLERTVEIRADTTGITLICTAICEEDIAVTVEFEVTAKNS